jgi:glycosyltransferase involved in cell wall biosynthesis
MDKKIKMLVVPSDRTGVGKFRSIDPHVYIAEHYKDEFDIDIVYQLPKENLEGFLKQYDIIHIHKQLDPRLEIMNMIKFLGIPVIVDVDDHYKLGDFHPMSLSAKKEKWHVPIIEHLRAADYVSTTTPIFAKELSKHNKNVLVFPNAINPEEEQYKEQVKKDSKLLRIGIICGSSHLHDIMLLKGVVNQVPLDKVQFVLCGFDTNGTRTIYHNDTGQVERRPILPEESVWFDYEKIITDNYKYISPQHKDFLLKFMKGVDDPFENESYRRMWTRDINKYATHYENVDVLLAPLKECEFNKMKSQLKEIEAGFTNTALIAQNFGAYTIDLKPIIGKGNVINEDGNCLLVDSSKNHKLWGKYITRLANDPELVAKLKKNLHDYVVNTYSIDKICAERVKTYKKIVEDSKK